MPSATIDLDPLGHPTVRAELGSASFVCPQNSCRFHRNLVQVSWWDWTCVMKWRRFSRGCAPSGTAGSRHWPSLSHAIGRTCLRPSARSTSSRLYRRRTPRTLGVTSRSMPRCRPSPRSCWSNRRESGRKPHATRPWALALKIVLVWWAVRVFARQREHSKSMGFDI